MRSREDAALAYSNRVRGHLITEPQRGIERYLKCPQIAVVDTDDVGARIDGFLQFFGIVYFHQRR